MSGQDANTTAEPGCSKEQRFRYCCRRHSREDQAGATPYGKGLWPLAVILGGRFGGIALLAVGAGTIERPDGVGFKLDNELLNRVFDALALAGGNFDRAIVLARGQLALHKNVSAFSEPVRQLREALAESGDVMPLGLFFPLVVLVLPGLLGRDGELRDRSAIRQILGFGVLANESDDRKLIEVHNEFFPSFCPAVLGRKNARLVAPKLENVLFWGTAKFFVGFTKGAAL